MRIVKIDFDRPTQLQLLRAFFLLKYLGADVLAYRTGNGWHLYAKFQRELTVQENLTIRRLLGDDPHRIWFDEIRLSHGIFLDWFDTLFLEKMTVRNGKKIKKSWEELANPMYEPWFLKREK